MTVDEQNEIDIARMMKKRGQALKLLDDFKGWYGNRTHNQVAEQILIMGLTRDILRGTEKEVDRLIEHLEERNQAAFLKKLSQ